jgi:hypothetical protein
MQHKHRSDEAHGIDRAVRAPAPAFDNLQDAYRSKSAQWFGLCMLISRLGKMQGISECIDQTPTHELQGLGGCRSSVMVERYAYLAPYHLAKTANRLDSLLGGLRFGYAGEERGIGRGR